MARLSRFERWFGGYCIALLLCVACSPSHASGQVAATSTTQLCANAGVWPGMGGVKACAITLAAIQGVAVAQEQAYYNGQPACSGTSHYQVYKGNFYGDYYFGMHIACPPNGDPGAGADNLYNVGAVIGYTCPSNSSLVAGTSSCACADPYAPSASGLNTCVIVCATGTVVSSGVYSSKDPSGGVMGANSSGCSQQGCTAVFQGFTPTGQSLIGGQRYYWFTGSYTTTGAICDGTQPPPPAAVASSAASMPASGCATGQAVGQVNGHPFCYQIDTGKPVDVPNQKDVTTTTPPVAGPNGTTVSTTTHTHTNADGTQVVDVTTTTTNADGSKTTTETQTGSGLTNPGGLGYADPVTGQSPSAASGSSGGSGSGGASGGCADNPSASGCGGTAHGVAAEYTERTRTFAQVMADRQTQWNSAPVISSASSFFAVTAGGSCPTYTLSLAYFGGHGTTIDTFCSTMAANMFTFMKAAILLACGFLAFKTAFL